MEPAAKAEREAQERRDALLRAAAADVQRVGILARQFRDYVSSPLPPETPIIEGNVVELARALDYDTFYELWVFKNGLRAVGELWAQQLTEVVGPPRRAQG